MKLLFSIFVLFFSASCAHRQQPVAQTNVNSRFPASNADTIDVAAMSNAMLIGYAGKNVLRVTIMCPVSAYAIVLSAVAETIPGVAGFPAMAVEGIQHEKFFGHVGGPVLGVGADLTRMGYWLLFEESPTFVDEAFKQTKYTYPLTKKLGQHFYSDNGICGSAGQKLVAVLTEIQRRQALAIQQ